MAAEHWFDSFHKRLAREAPRRGIVRAALALTIGHRLGGPDAKAKNGKENKKDKKHRKQNKNKDKNRNRNKPDPSCATVCAREFELHPEEIPACVQKCNDCRIRDNFCVIEGDDSDPKKIATCCFEGDQCCQNTHACCPSDSVCCPGYPQDSPMPCCENGQTCCPSDYFGCCSAGQTCCPGEGCANLTRHQRNCGSCGNRCQPDEICSNGACEPAPPGSCPGRTLCDGYCVDVERDRSHCGQCRKICREGQSCNAGRCEPEGWECCDTDRGAVCTYTTGPNARDHWHCGACGYRCPGNQSCIAGACRCLEEEHYTWCAAQQLCLLGLPC